MYTTSVPFKDLYGKPRNMTIHLNLFETEVFKLLGEFKKVFNWRDSIQSTEMFELETAEVIEFYTALEEILLSSYGKPTDDGLGFDKTDRFKFADSALFNATMMMFVTDPAKATEMLDGLMPKGMDELVKKADDNLAALAKAEGTDKDTQRKIAELQAELDRARAAAPETPSN